MVRFTALVIASLVLTPAGAFGAPCRDGKGKFVKCASATPAKPAKCKDAKGKFARCGTAGAKPV